jgi:hypothetical protein
MPKLPNSPNLERLRELAPGLILIPAGTTVVRIYQRGGEHPTVWNRLRYFGPTGARFDHHLRDEEGRPHVQDRGILYLATDISTSLAEVFQASRTIDREGDKPWLVSFRLACDLSLLNLTDTFCVQAGGSMKLVSGPKLYAQNWSRAFYECYEEIHGIYFLSSLTNRPTIALYERALAVGPFPNSPRVHRGLDDVLLIETIRNASKEIGYVFV